MKEEIKMAEACSSFPTVSKAGKKYMYKSSPTNPFYKFYAVYEILKTQITYRWTKLVLNFFPLKELTQI